MQTEQDGSNSVEPLDALAALQSASISIAQERDPFVDGCNRYRKLLRRHAMFARSICVCASFVALLAFAGAGVTGDAVAAAIAAAYGFIFSALYYWARKQLAPAVLVACTLYTAGPLLSPWPELRLLGGSVAVFMAQIPLVVIPLYALYQHRAVSRLLARHIATHTRPTAPTLAAPDGSGDPNQAE